MGRLGGPPGSAKRTWGFHHFHTQSQKRAPRTGRIAIMRIQSCRVMAFPPDVSHKARQSGRISRLRPSASACEIKTILRTSHICEYSASAIGGWIRSFRMVVRIDWIGLAGESIRSEIRTNLRGTLPLLSENFRTGTERVVFKRRAQRWALPRGHRMLNSFYANQANLAPLDGDCPRVPLRIPGDPTLGQANAICGATRPSHR